MWINYLIVLGTFTLCFFLVRYLNTFLVRYLMLRFFVSFEVYRAGSPFSGKFVLFKPVLFVQVWPVGIQDVGPGDR